MHLKLDLCSNLRHQAELDAIKLQHRDELAEVEKRHSRARDRTVALLADKVGVDTNMSTVN